MYKSNPYENTGKPDSPEEAIAYYSDAVRKGLGQSGGGSRTPEYLTKIQTVE